MFLVATDGVSFVSQIFEKSLLGGLLFLTLWWIGHRQEKKLDAIVKQQMIQNLLVLSMQQELLILVPLTRTFDDSAVSITEEESRRALATYRDLLKVFNSIEEQIRSD